MAGSASQFITHGCRLNAYESHAMQTLAASSANSDLVVINTCAVTSEAVRKARQEVRK
ncbi:MAG: tRNA (N(6)-L-threonylcarbamoyladenosine(37)-C(2))-methylthiotransferase MtaB, partial [Halocynthiibacter sp.]